MRTSVLPLLALALVACDDPVRSQPVSCPLNSTVQVGDRWIVTRYSYNAAAGQCDQKTCNYPVASYTAVQASSACASE
jgi:hypothetical protein